MHFNKSLLISTIYTAQIAQRNINIVLKTPVCVNMQTALQAQLSNYMSIEQEAQHIAAARGWDMAAIHTGTLWLSGFLLQIRFHSSRTNTSAAAWIIDCSTKSLINGIKLLRRYEYKDERVIFVCQKLLDCQQENIRQMQRFI